MRDRLSLIEMSFDEELFEDHPHTNIRVPTGQI